MKGPRILVADDEKVSRMMLETSVRRWGYEVVAASDGDEAWALLQGDAPPGVAILDWMMPGLQGDEICRRVRGTPGLESLYVILLTAKGNTEDLVAGMSAGADDFITKPFHPDELRVRIRSGSRIVELQKDLAERLVQLDEHAKRLSQSEEQFQELVRNIDEAFWLTSADLGQVLYVSPMFETIWGVTCERLLANPNLWTEAIHPEDRPQALERLARDRLRESVEETYRIVRPDGEVRWIQDRRFPIRNDAGEVVRIAGIAQDVTRRKQAEQERALIEIQLRQAQKLESIGQLAAGIAHEINTPIQYVGDNIRFFQEAFADLGKVLEAHEKLLEAYKEAGGDPEQARAVEKACEEADLEYLRGEIPKALTDALAGVGRVAHIVRSMKEFSHPGGNEKTPIDLHKAIENTITVARNEWKYVAEMETDFDPNLPPVPCLPDELNQVILNLIVNAAHAIAGSVDEAKGEKGTIKVTTRLDHEWVEILVSDTGCGIPESIRSKVFDPFFTTKEVGKGTGQGLAIAHAAVVTKHGGTIDFDTEEGRGTTFRVRLPVERDPDGAAAVEARGAS